MALGRLAIETGLWVNYETVDGELEKAKKIVNRKPVEEYLKAQKRFRHLFRPDRNEEEIAKIQAIADRNAKKFGIDVVLKK
jgi:pyruvate ferredoxin oxidoreductase beta subunit